MNPVVYQSKVNTLSGIESRVFEAVPASEAWGAGSIVRELSRIGTHVGMSQVQGVLSKLCDMKIVKGNPADGYQRVSVKISQAGAAPGVEVKAGPTPAQSPLERLASLASDLRTIAKAVDDVALSVQAELDVKSEAAQKIEALKQVFREL